MPNGNQNPNASQFIHSGNRRSHRRIAFLFLELGQQKISSLSSTIMSIVVSNVFRRHVHKSMKVGSTPRQGQFA